MQILLIPIILNFSSIRLKDLETVIQDSYLRHVKNLRNFWWLLEMPLANWKIELKLKWIKY